MTIREAFSGFVSQLLAVYEENEAKNIGKIVFEDTFNLRHFSSENIFLHEKKMSQILNKLLKNEPVQYVLEEADFYGLKFFVNRSVLIPRQETEELVHLILQKYPKPLTVYPISVLDIGTGSGCIAVTIQKKRPAFDVWAIDFSESALKIARQNANRHETDVRLVCSDILNKENWTQFPDFHIIVSNPPYIANKEKELMSANVLDFEPHEALFVSDENSLLFYETIAAFSILKLRPDGTLFFECNEFNAPQVVELLQSKGFCDVTLHTDMQGKHRMVEAKIKKLLPL